MLFALAYAASVSASAPLVLAALPKMARTGTHLFTLFVLDPSQPPLASYNPNSVSMY